MNEPGYLALGDSYTIGEGVNAADRWPEQLARALRAAGSSVADPQIIARTGWTTDELAAALADARVEGPFALVSLLIGVNDQYRGRSSIDFRDRFHSLLDTAIALAGRHAGAVVVLSIPDWGVTPFAEGRDRRRIAGEIAHFNAAASREVARTGAHWVDVTPASRDVRPDWIAPDGLHPSGAQYSAWTALALEPAAAALRAM